MINLFVVVQVVAERALKVLRSDEVESRNYPEDELITLNAEEEELGKYWLFSSVSNTVARSKHRVSGQSRQKVQLLLGKVLPNKKKIMPKYPIRLFLISLRELFC